MTSILHPTHHWRRDLPPFFCASCKRWNYVSQQFIDEVRAEHLSKETDATLASTAEWCIGGVSGTPVEGERFQWYIGQHVTMKEQERVISTRGDRYHPAGEYVLVDRPKRDGSGFYALLHVHNLPPQFSADGIEPRAIYWSADEAHARDFFSKVVPIAPFLTGDAVDVLRLDPASSAAAQARMDGALPPSGYDERLPDDLWSLLVRLEDAVTAEDLPRLWDARKDLSEYLLAKLPTEEDDIDPDDPKCMGCGEAPADQCRPVVVWYAEESVTPGALPSEQVRYCPECIDAARSLTERHDVVRCILVGPFRVPGIPATFSIDIAQHDPKDVHRVIGLCGISDAARDLVFSEDRHPVRYWPYSRAQLQRLNVVAGTSFDLSEFTHA